MNPVKFRALVRRRFPYPNIMIQCDAVTTPKEYADRGMVCAVVTWLPDQDKDGNIIDEGFHDPDRPED